MSKAQQLLEAIYNACNKPTRYTDPYPNLVLGHQQYNFIMSEMLKLQLELGKAKECLEFYADPSIWGNGCAAIDPCDTYTDELGVLRGGARARELLKEVKK